MIVTKSRINTQSLIMDCCMCCISTLRILCRRDWGGKCGVYTYGL